MMDDPARETALGIVPRAQRLIVGKCLTQGMVKVMAPVCAIIFGGLALALFSDPFGLREPASQRPGAMLLFLATTWPVWIGWVYWSVATPKWRTWALQNVDDWKTLEARAVAGMLIWPRGWIFEKTEIKSADRRKLEADLLQYRDRHG
jgi:hypothetical protein